MVNMTHLQAAAILGVVFPGASANDLRSAYRAKCKGAHPDVGGSASAFDAVTSAYAVLTGRVAASAAVGGSAAAPGSAGVRPAARSRRRAGRGALPAAGTPGTGRSTA